MALRGNFTVLSKDMLTCHSSADQADSEGARITRRDAGEGVSLSRGVYVVFCVPREVLFQQADFLLRSGH